MRIRPWLLAALVLVASPLFAVHHHFHAQAIAIGGDVPAAAAVSLTPTVRETSPSAQHYHANGTPFDEAITAVSGVADRRASVTTALLPLRNADILGRRHTHTMR